MGFIKSQLLKVIQWQDSSADTIAYRFEMPPKYEIMNGSMLVVNESQVAVLVSSGQIADVFTPGRYKLDTGNMPVLTKLRSWKYAFESPFQADVYYINTKQFLNQKWGTSTPVMMRDQDYGAVQFRAYGVFTFRVTDPALFLRDLMGTGASFKVKDVVEQLKRTVVSGVTESVAASNIPALDLATKYTSLGDGTIDIVRKKFLLRGIDLVTMDIENISLTEESQAALTKRTNMTILGNAAEYTQFQAADAMRDVAANAHKGTGMNIPGMGVGFGTGMMMTNAYTGTIAGAQAEAKANAAAPKPETAKCPKCGHLNEKNAKFCLDCGASLKVACPKCGASVKDGAKFCPECGEKLITELKCPACGKPAKPGTKFCEECGAKLA
ncbi:MAG: SPFH domain-containing protein [Clostridiales bacterium]|jgi:membrane protease subunit (stomatin/prohibitin family)|nr:SPFH domain-containing protein [Clostridiales bacterium]